MNSWTSPQGQAAVSRLWADLAAVGHGALLLDYDGTLAPFHTDPRQALPYPGVRDLLDAIVESGRTRLAIVTGRAARELLPLLGLRRPPEIWGSHGREYLDSAGRYSVEQISQTALHCLVAVDDWTPQIELAGGWVESKPGAVAIHWRGLSARRADSIREIIRGVWRVEQLDRTLEWHNFDGGIELRAPGCSKGRVVATVVGESTDNGPCAYLGDDATDEEAFAAVRGRGIGVLVGAVHRASAADLWIQPPGQLIEFLLRWSRSGGASR